MRIFRAAVLALTAFVAVPASAQVTLKFANFSPASSKFNQQLMPPFIEALGKDSDGELKIDYFPGGTLGRAPDAQLRLLKTGVADIAWIIPYYTPGEFPDNDVFEVPLLVRNGIEGSLAITRMHQKGLLRGYDDLKVIALLIQPPNIVHTTFPVKEPGDLNGRKIRSAGVIQQLALESLGATPVGGLTGPQVAENVSRGLIDGAFSDWVATVSFRISSVTSHHYDLPIGSTAGMIAMRKSVYDKLPPKAKAAIDKHAGEPAALYFSRGFDRLAKESKVLVAGDSKQTVLELTEDGASKWSEALKPAVETWLKGEPNRRATFEAAQEILADIRKSAPK